MKCFRFTSFRFSGRCCECGAIQEWHDVGSKFYCGACCPGCRVAKPFEDEPLPESVSGEQVSLFGGANE